jgi:hypothetical protein
MKAFCPKCGREMVTQFRGSDLVSAECVFGNMPLSKALIEIINEEFFNNSIDKTVSVPVYSPSSWFCPRDGEQLCQANRFSYCCRKCGRSLEGGALRRLVELHPHRQ